MLLVFRRHLFPIAALVLLGTGLGFQVNSYLGNDDVQDQGEKLKEALVKIDRYYTNPVSTQDLAEEGIRGMVDDLDPHSSYIPADRMRDLRDRYEGSFGGVGISFEVVDDTARVVSPLPGGPSQKAGVQAGDRIIAIEDSSAIGISSSGLQDRLKGRLGTEVSFTVYRSLSDKHLNFTVKRDEISYRTVTAAHMIDETTGYLRIGRFAKPTHSEFTDAVESLKSKGMDRLVLDLRGNRGGVMQSSIQIADEMLGTAGATIVETRYRRASANRTYEASSGGRLTSEPISVLVDQGSASASEILTGALQDHDRALVVGRRTFGKALVQKPFSLADGSALQLTVGHYYTPTGRLIQTPYEKGEIDAYYEGKSTGFENALFNAEEYRRSLPDSLRYRTDHGRTVFGGGGILPDEIVSPDTTSLAAYVRRSGLAQQFARKWFSDHEISLRSTWQDREDAFSKEYKVPSEALSAFWTFAQKEDFLALRDSAEASKEERVYQPSAAEAARDAVRSRIKGHLAGILYGLGAARPILNKTSPIVQRALNSWSASEALADYHGAASPQESG